jgi:hypothetical protein
VRDDRGNGVMLVFFASPDHLGTSMQLPARILIEVIHNLCGLVPVENEIESSENVMDDAA